MKDKAGALPFYMYMSEESYKNAEEQALTSMQELFKAVSSTKKADTPTRELYILSAMFLEGLWNVRNLESGMWKSQPFQMSPVGAWYIVSYFYS